MATKKDAAARSADPETSPRDSRAPLTFRQYQSLILYAIWMTALTGLVLWAAYQVRKVLLLIYISGLLAIGLSPIVRLIEKQTVLPIGTRRFPRWLAILVVYLIIIGTLTGIGFLVFPPLVDQAQQFGRALPDMFDRAQTFLISKGLLDHPMSLKEVVERAPVSGSTDAVGTVFGTIIGVIGGVFGFLTILILTFYVLVDADQLRNQLLRLFPPSQRARVSAASRDVTMKVSAWLSGQLFLGTTIGVTSAIGLALLGVPFFYVLALVSGIGELIPIVGPIVSAIPAILVAATVSWEKALFVLIFFVVQQQFENHVLVPKIMSRQVGVSAVTVIVSLLIGGNLLGVLGAILAVPTAAILLVVFNELRE
jgi:predicted PurR-regulated permease PerM